MPSRWRSYSIYLLRQLLKKLDKSDSTLEVWETEQFMYRFLTCEDCVQAGECQHSDCRCKMPARAQVRTDFCPTLKWGPFLNKEGWESFKRRESIKFIINKIEKNV